LTLLCVGLPMRGKIGKETPCYDNDRFLAAKKHARSGEWYGLQFIVAWVTLSRAAMAVYISILGLWQMPPCTEYM